MVLTVVPLYSKHFCGRTRGNTIKANLCVLIAPSAIAWVLKHTSGINCCFMSLYSETTSEAVPDFCWHRTPPCITRSQISPLKWGIVSHFSPGGDFNTFYGLLDGNPNGYMPAKGNLEISLS